MQGGQCGQPNNHQVVTVTVFKHKTIVVVRLGRVFTSNFSLAKINCHRNFGKVFAFTHSNEKLKRKFVEESFVKVFCHIIFAVVFTRMMINQRKLPE